MTPPSPVLDPTEVDDLPPRILQGELVQAGTTLMMRIGHKGGDLVNVASILRRYRNRHIIIVIIDPNHIGVH